MTNNPLIAKWEEIHGKKKEEPKKVELEGTVQLSKEQLDIVSKYLTDPKIYSTTSATSVTAPTNINPNSVSAITAANPYISKLISYDNESLTDSFLQIAEKLKNKQAKVTSMNMDIDHQTRTHRITFEVWDSF